MRLRYPAPLSCLAAFECVARHGSVSRAATELNLTQSAVSRQVLHLEASLGVALFNRVRRRLVLTSVGESYAADVRQILRELVETSYRAMGATSGKTIGVSALPTFAARWLIPRLPTFLAGHPGLTVNVSTHLERFDFAAAPFDAAIHFGAADWPGAECSFLFEEEMVVVCSPALLSAHPCLAAKDFAGVALLHQSTRPTAWADWLGAAGLPTEAAFRGPRFTQFSLIAQAASVGIGLGILPRVLVEGELAAGQLVAPFDQTLTTAGAYFVVCPESRAASPEVRSFVRWIVGEAAAPPI